MTGFFIGFALGSIATVFAYPAVSRWIDRHF